MNIQSIQQLKNSFLIAMPSMANTWFSQSVILICEHDLDITMGLVLNKPLGMQLGELFEQMDIVCADMNLLSMPVFKGGPVQSERGFVLHTGYKDFPGTQCISDNLYLSTSKEVLEDIAKGVGPAQFLVALGYSGWGEYQLMDEICANAWLTAPMNTNIIFDEPPYARWEAAARQVGVEIRHLCTAVGHA